MIGKEIGNYRILKELGKGGMGVVYKANQVSLSRMVAMKVLPKHLTNDLAFIKRFKNEARAIAKLNHPNIVQIYDIGQEEDIYYYTMEFIEGPALDEIIYKEGSLPFDRAINIAAQVARGLQYAHSQGIVHRDIKPSNIMIDKAGRVKVTDFGLALQQRVARLTVQGDIVGTPEYMSPEQAVGQQATVRSDIYSLGVVCYEMLTGRVPFEGATPLMVLNKIKASDPQWPSSINPDVPLEVEKLTKRMMAKNPRDRYASCQEIIQDIQRVRVSLPISMRSRRRSAARRLTMGIAALIFLGLIAGGVFAVKTLNHNDQEPIKTFLQLPNEASFRPVAMTAAVALLAPNPARSGMLDEMRQRLVLLDEQIKEIQRQYGSESFSVLKNTLSGMKRRFSALEDQFGSMQASLYPDLLLLKKGNEIKGKIIDESLEKVYVRTSLGPKTEIPRNKIRLTVYATENERHLADTLQADLPAIGTSIADLKEAFDTVEKELEQKRSLSEEGAPADAGTGKEIRPEDLAKRMVNEGLAVVQIPMTEETWDADSDCDEGATYSFVDDTLSITTDGSTQDSTCTLNVLMAASLEGIPDTIQVLVQVQQESPSETARASLSLAVTFPDDISVEYYLYESPAAQPDVEEFQTDDTFVIRRAHNIIPADGEWHTLTLFLNQDAEAAGEAQQPITGVELIQRQAGSNGGLFTSRCRMITVNMQEAPSGPS